MYHTSLLNKLVWYNIGTTKDNFEIWNYLIPLILWSSIKKNRSHTGYKSHKNSMWMTNKVVRSYAALLWQKEAIDKVTFFVKEQNVSVISTDAWRQWNIMMSYLTYLLAGWVFMHKIWPGRRAHWVKYENINNSDLDGMSLAPFCQSRALWYVDYVHLHIRMKHPDSILALRTKTTKSSGTQNFTTMTAFKICTSLMTNAYTMHMWVHNNMKLW